MSDFVFKSVRDVGPMYQYFQKKKAKHTHKL